jgi:dipeptidyl aminopeptidase/acylaminoacyl peptidase
VPTLGSTLPGRIFVGAGLGLRTADDETRLFQYAIAIDPNTGSWTRLQNLREAGGISVPLSPVRVSPDGRTMLFMRENELWKCDARTGQGAERVLEKGSPTAWAPDGKSFVVLLPKGDSPFLEVENWLVNAVTLDRSKITLPVEDAVEDWSPDGQWLLVATRKAGHISLVKPDGSGRQRITTVTEFDSLSDPRPRFSPDGRRIVYLRVSRSGDEEARTATFSLRTINIDGTDDREVLGERQVDPAANPTIWTAPLAARWSPDGKHLAVVLFDHSQKGGIAAIDGNWRFAIMDADGRNLRELKLDGVLITVLPWDGPEWRPLATP